MNDKEVIEWRNIKMVKTKRNKEIVEHLKQEFLPGKEIIIEIYNDGCWWIQIEKLRYNRIRFWAGCDYKRYGYSRSSMCTIYPYNGDVIISTDGLRLKKTVMDKLKSVYKELVKNKLI